MPLPSFLQRLRQRSTPSVADASPLSSADIEVARVRARRRLVGMVVLVGVGVVGLPWLFETQPRPLSSEVQVVSAVPSRTPATSGPARAIASVTVPVTEAPAEVVEEEIETSPSKPVNKPAARPSAPTMPASKPAAPARVQAVAQAAAPSKPAVKESAKEPVKKETPKPAVVAADNAASKDAARARALLEDKKTPAVKPAVAKPEADAAGTRYVVQIGAFADGSTAREVRLKAERAGVKTYTQEVVANGGKKIRVRVGPYANKAEADKAVETLRKAGLTSALLTL